MMAVKSNLCFSTFVFGSYQKYIPYYIYSIARTYPDAYAKVIIEGNLYPEINEVINFLKVQLNFNFEILELNTSFDNYNRFKMKGGGAKTMVRYMFDSSYYKNYKYIYIGDVDIMFFSEEVSLLDFHVSQMKKYNLPFSNKVRVDSFGNLTDRLTGLHFLEVKKYFNKIDVIIQKLVKSEYYMSQYLIGLERDENFLYKICMEAFDFNPVQVSKMQRPWHGLHLGITRENKDIDIKTIEENSSISLDEIKKHLSSYQNDPIFSQIQSKVFVIELYEILKQLKMHNRTDWKWNAIKYQCFSRINSFKKKVKRLIHV